ncbi:MAG: GIY-YIG nuclease family protein [Gammaproteobacteria bacterium]|nr:GIY-YIG nuclease family protein [Gammaproteobacteria bacterium]
MNKDYYIYILASKRHGALFVGTTSDLAGSVMDHKCNMVEGLTSLYAIHQLVYFEHHDEAAAACARATAIRQMHRIWKLDLVEQHNPDWCDLYEDISEPFKSSDYSCNPAAI